MASIIPAGIPRRPVPSYLDNYLAQRDANKVREIAAEQEQYDRGQDAARIKAGAEQEQYNRSRTAKTDATTAQAKQETQEQTLMRSRIAMADWAEKNGQSDQVQQRVDLVTNKMFESWGQKPPGSIPFDRDVESARLGEGPPPPEKKTYKSLEADGRQIVFNQNDPTDAIDMGAAKKGALWTSAQEGVNPENNKAGFFQTNKETHEIFWLPATPMPRGMNFQSDGKGGFTFSTGGEGITTGAKAQAQKDYMSAVIAQDQMEEAVKTIEAAPDSAFGLLGKTREDLGGYAGQLGWTSAETFLASDALRDVRDMVRLTEGRLLPVLTGDDRFTDEDVDRARDALKVLGNPGSRRAALNAYKTLIKMNEMVVGTLGEFGGMTDQELSKFEW